LWPGSLAQKSHACHARSKGASVSARYQLYSIDNATTRCTFLWLMGLALALPSRRSSAISIRQNTLGIALASVAETAFKPPRAAQHHPRRAR
jgi:hypothetical protein